MSADIVGDKSTKLRSILTKWHSISPGGFQKMNKLIYKLEHKYTESSLSLSNLKSRDRRVCQALYEIGLECGFTIFLAKLNRTHREEVWCGFDDNEDVEETNLEYVKTCDGHTICRRMEIDEREIMGKIWDRTADSEEDGGFTGNESMPAILRYHDTVVIICPTYHLCSLPVSTLQPHALISLVGEAIAHRPDHHRQVTSLFDFLEMVVRHGNIDSTFLCDAIAIALKYKQKLLYQSVIRLALRRSDAQQRVLGKIVQLMKASLDGDAIESPDWDYWFGDVFTEASKQSLTTLQNAMHQVESMLQEEALDNVRSSFECWISPIPDNLMESKSKWDMNDFAFLKCHIFSRGSVGGNWLAWFITTLSYRGSRELICEMLRVVYDERNANTLLSAKDTFQSILEASVDKLALQIQDFPISGHVTGTPGTPQLPGALGELASAARKTIEVIDQAFNMGLAEQATNLLDKSCTNIYQYCPKPRTKSAPGPLVVRDSLLCLVTVLQKHQVTPHGSLKDMFVVLLRNILVSYPPERPMPPRGWAHKPRPACRQNAALYPCKDCETLNRFLQDPDRETYEFRMAQYRQRHLMEQLPRQLYYCQPEKKPPMVIIRKLGNEYKEEMKKYKTELTLFEDHVRALRCDYVKLLLGEDLYEELVLLRDIPDSVGSMQTKRGEKRKAEEEGDGSSASRPQLIE
ncbi:hypothetical protein F5B19DRAFT_433884 [Rostrohypoxylon terebratum]|nr:hypothetical protein F5B19DRAFT_433884 [Rostrohypoxylon terebratum]